LFDEIDSGTKVSGSFQVSTGGFLDIDAKVCALGTLCPATAPISQFLNAARARLNMSVGCRQPPC